MYGRRFIAFLIVLASWNSLNTCGSDVVPLDDPSDLSKWFVTAPPENGDDRFWDAYEDETHKWVVTLLDGRPVARLWTQKREEGDSYPEIQEAYPSMPFEIKQDPKVNGHSGEWFSKKVVDSWIIGFNKGEWGGALWWYSADGKTRLKISEDQVVGFLETEQGLLALEGCSHGSGNAGKILRLEKRNDGRWHSELFVNLEDAPEIMMKDGDGTVVVVTIRKLVRVDLHTKQIDLLLGKAFWSGLQPTSIVRASSGSLFIGMRHGIVEVEKIGPVYNPKWLVPDADYAKAAQKARADRPTGFR